MYSTWLSYTCCKAVFFLQKKDYPDKHRLAKETMETADKKSELSTKLKEICFEIESKEGRKVELIKRVIVSSTTKKGTLS